MATTARDVMQSEVVTIGPHDPLDRVQRLFFEEEIHGAPVVEDDGRVVGIVTSMDLVRSSADDDDREPGPGTSEYLADLLEYSPSDWARDTPSAFSDRVASDIMTEDPITVGPDTGVPDVARVLSENRIHRVLVVEGSRLCGIISTSDLVALLAARK